ncbi:MAG: sigma-70 family RNA polymerase sigma factor [Clostridiales bacterium]|nr:sigma-70 family RNA polymerase sigma factor [Clostridiales bacterium]
MRNKRFENCFQKYYRLVKYVVREKTSDPLLAEEIEQQVFCDFYVHMDEIQPEAEKAWLLRCTRNKVVDHLRKEQKWNEFLTDAGRTETDSLLVDGTAVLCEERFLMRELTGRILRQVKEVNVQWYEVLKLCFVEELSYSEAANRLNISTSVLRSRICRARAYVRKVFWDEYKKGEPES